MGISLDILAVTIFIFLIGPAFVFIQFFHLGIQVAIYWKLKYRLSSSDMESESPHKNIFTYMLYPTVLAITIWLSSYIPIISYEKLRTNSIDEIMNPVWLIRYTVFIGYLSFISITFGLIYGYIMLLFWKNGNKQITDEKPIEQDFCKHCGKLTRSGNDT